MRIGTPLDAIEKLFIHECCKSPDVPFQILLALKPVDALTEEQVEKEYSHLVQLLENRAHNVQGGPVSSKVLDEVYELPICVGKSRFLFSDPSSEPSQISQLPVKGGSGVVSSAFVADLVELFLTSLNKYVATRVIQQLSDWAYHILHGTSSRRVFLPGESDSFIEKPRVQTSRGIMVQGFLSVFWGDYKKAVDLFCAATLKVKKDPYLEASRLVNHLSSSLQRGKVLLSA